MMGTELLMLMEQSYAMEIFIKVTCILTAAWCVYGIIRKGNPYWRVLLWRMTLIGIALLPLAAWLTPGFTLTFQTDKQPNVLAMQNEIRLEMLKNNGTSAINNSPQDIATGSVENFNPISTRSTIEHSTRIDWSWINYNTVLIAVCLTGSLIFAIRLARDFFQLSRVVKNTKPAPQELYGRLRATALELGFDRAIALRYSSKITVPFLKGVLHPTILLPERMLGNEYADDLPAVFAHEICHARHNDVFWTALFHIAQTVLWFHPLTWFINKAHSSSCEEVSDAATSAYVGDADFYSKTLAKIALEVTAYTPAYGGIAMARSSKILKRLEFLQKKIAYLPPAKRWLTLFFLSGGIFAAVLSGLQFSIANAAQEILEETSGDTLAGIVKRTDGAVAADASVYLILDHLIVTNGYVQQYDGKLDRSDNTKQKRITDEDGSFTFPSPVENGYVMAIDDWGYGKTTVNELKDTKSITIQPWATVKGTLQVNGTASPNETVTLTYSYRQTEEILALPDISLSDSTTTDEQGNFTFSRVIPTPPGDTFVSHQTGTNGNYIHSHQTNLLIEPGKIITAQLGGSGRTVTGRIDRLPQSLDANRTITAISRKREFPKPPENWKTMTEEELNQWQQNWLESDEGKRYQQMAFRSNFAIEEDGSFRVHDVPEGEYSLDIRFYNRPAPGFPGLGELIATIPRQHKSFTLPAAETVGEGFDLGVIPIDIIPRVGDPAPDFDAETFDKKPVNLSGYRGNYLIMTFFIPGENSQKWSEPIRKLYDEFGSNKSIKFLGLNVENESETAAAYVEQYPLPWTQAYLGKWSSSEVASDYGVTVTIPRTFLIDPNGVIAAKDLENREVYEAVKAILE